MFGKRKDDEDPFAALRGGGTFQSEPTTAADIGLDAKPAEIPSGSPSQAFVAPLPDPTVAPASPTTSAPSPAFTAQQQTIPAPAAPPTPTPTPTPQASSGWQSVPGAIGRRRRRSSGIGFGLSTGVRIAVFLVVIAAIGIPLASVKNAIHSIKIPSFNFGQSSTSASGSLIPTAKHVSYLQPGNLRVALARIRKLEPGGRLTLLRVDGDSLSVNASRPGAGAKEIYFGPSGTSIISGVSSGQRPVPISEIKPGVVGSLVAEMRTRFHVPSRRIDYIVLSSPPGLPPMWILFTKAPSHPGYSAALNGAGLKRLGT